MKKQAGSGLSGRLAAVLASAAPVMMTRPMGLVAGCSRSGNTFDGGLAQPTHYRRGQQLIVRTVGPAADRWEFRIDGAPSRS
jgi:hypothetical protein